MTTALHSAPVAVFARFSITAVAFFLLALPQVCASATLTLIDSSVQTNNDHICWPSVWLPDFPEIWNGRWVCVQGNTESSEFLRAANTAFEINSFASVDTTIVGESWVLHDYTHTWQVGLDGAAGSQSDAWLYATVDGLVSVYALGVGFANAHSSVGLQVWQGAFDGWGTYLSPEGFQIDGPMLNGVVTDPYKTVGWSAYANGIFAWWDEDPLTGSYHQPLGLTLTAGDPATNLWIKAGLQTTADAVALYVPPWGLGTGGAQVDLYLGGRGFRYGLALDSTPPAGWSEVSRVPEPGTLGLLSLGLLGLGFTARRRFL